MLSNVEKVLILKSVVIFRHPSDNVRADPADLLEDLDVSANETIFEKGGMGDSRVRMHESGRLENRKNG